MSYIKFFENDLNFQPYKSYKFFNLISNLYNSKVMAAFKIQVHISIKTKQETYMAYMFRKNKLIILIQILDFRII